MGDPPVPEMRERRLVSLDLEALMRRSTLLDRLVRRYVGQHTGPSFCFRGRFGPREVDALTKSLGPSQYCPLHLRAPSTCVAAHTTRQRPVRRIGVHPVRRRGHRRRQRWRVRLEGVRQLHTLKRTRGTRARRRAAHSGLWCSPSHARGGWRAAGSLLADAAW